jgi:CheY-like chemotaxis protein
MARILLIEDNSASLELMKYVLEAFGYIVQSTRDGKEGLEAARRESPALIICDIYLPEIDGYEVARQLKADAKLKSIPLIAVTALAMVGDQDKGLVAGFDGYMAKPIDPQRFIIQIEHFLQAAPRDSSPQGKKPDGDHPNR